MKWPRSISVVPRSKPERERPFPVVEPLETRKLLSADLTPAFAALPVTLPSGGSDQVTIQLANSGSSAARGRVTVDLYASPDGSLGSNATLLTAANKALNLKAGKSASLPLRFLSPTTLPDGSYFLVAAVSGSGAASSSVISSGPVTIVQPFVDLTAKIARLPVSAVQTGRRLSRMTIDVFNQGNVTAKGQVSVTVYVSVDGKLDVTAIPLNVSLPKSVHIKPGESNRLAVYFNALPGLAPGQYYLIAQVNPGRGITERDLTNNLAASASPVQVVRAPHHSHGSDCYLELDNYYYPDPYFDAGEIYYPPIDTSADTVTEPTTDPTTQPAPDATTDPTTAPTTDPTTTPTTGVFIDPTTAPTTDPTTAPSPDPTPAPTTDPTTQPSTGDTSSGGGSIDTSGGSSSDSSGSSSDSSGGDTSFF